MLLFLRCFLVTSCVVTGYRLLSMVVDVVAVVVGSVVVGSSDGYLLLCEER